MPSPAQNSDAIMRAAGQSLAHQRAGGRRVGSIGRQSARLKRGHLAKKIGRILLAVGGIWLASSLLSLFITPIGLLGLVGTVLLSFIAVGVLATFPKMQPPTIDTLAKGDVKTMVGRTEMWLERQRPALPPPAVKLVNHIGLQLDGLGAQLKDIDPLHPAVGEVRKLVGEHLPQVVEGYRRIPEHLRYEDRAGTNPNKQFMESLGLISNEIDSVTRQLATGAIDDLAIKTRYLDYKYGSAMEKEEGAQ
ncbi:hypothetical protein [Novosphingobium sp. TH158]|uniref:hypothetical protein n=1 Tax=Novosphingobium sp. TH158 TaxID=2067455 RepID=UPI000C7C05F9|nr:hypothetical protein [Novosphingobium sp. TH158]PLK24458.1 hypothetical protein C0V78_14570 [Novosphingobium sp. TH158]